MSSIEKEAKVQAVQIEPNGLSRQRITGNQQILMDLILTCLKESTPITMDAIIKAYRASDTWYSKANEFNVYGFHEVNGKHVYASRTVPWDHPNARHTMEFRAMSWFRSNLGSCIVKGKLIAIPVIEAQ
jgi:hypothetical protein